MTKDAAVELISSANAYDRLRAARYFARHHSFADRDLLIHVYKAESLSWIKNSLQRTIKTIDEDSSSENSLPILDVESDEELNIEDVKAVAVEEITHLILHELGPRVGLADLAARRELADSYDGSQTKLEFDRIRQFLDALRTWGQAASQAKFESFDLSNVIHTTIAAIPDCPIEITVAGPDQFLAVGDPRPISIAIRNGLANAIEATLAIIDTKTLDNIVINWGDSDVDYWIFILDSGIGLPPASSSMWTLGTTSKIDHAGAGLMIARQAMTSLGGKVQLVARASGGVRYELRWPKRST